jgi:hypothetical protein
MAAWLALWEGPLCLLDIGSKVNVELKGARVRVGAVSTLSSQLFLTKPAGKSWKTSSAPFVHEERTSQPISVTFFSV